MHSNFTLFYENRKKEIIWKKKIQPFMTSTNVLQLFYVFEMYFFFSLMFMIHNLLNIHTTINFNSQIEKKHQK